MNTPFFHPIWVLPSSADSDHLSLASKCMSPSCG